MRLFCCGFFLIEKMAKKKYDGSGVHVWIAKEC